MLILSVVGVPDLCKEGIGLCYLVIIPNLFGKVAFGTPVTAEKDKRGACFKFGTATAALPAKFGGHVALLHLCGKALAASELCSLFHIGKSKLRKGLGLIIAVVELVLLGSFIALIGAFELELIPF